MVLHMLSRSHIAMQGRDEQPMTALPPYGAGRHMNIVYGRLRRATHAPSLHCAVVRQNARTQRSEQAAYAAVVSPTPHRQEACFLGNIPEAQGVTQRQMTSQAAPAQGCAKEGQPSRISSAFISRSADSCRALLSWVGGGGFEGMLSSC